MEPHSPSWGESTEEGYRELDGTLGITAEKHLQRVWGPRYYTQKFTEAEKGVLLAQHQRNVEKEWYWRRWVRHLEHSSWRRELGASKEDGFLRAHFLEFSALSMLRYAIQVIRQKLPHAVPEAVLDVTMRYLQSSEAFDESLLQWKTYIEKFDIQHTVPVQHVLKRSRELLQEMLNGGDESGIMEESS